MLLLVAPLAYFEFLAPKPGTNLSQETYPLTERQIKAAWPNLPTAEQIVKSGVYGYYDTNDYIVSPNSTADKIYLQTPPHWWDNYSITLIIQNETETNLPAAMGNYPHGLIPITYQIYLEINSTIWIQVPQTYLANTSHPPVALSETNNGFLGTNMPTIYGVAAITIVSATVVLGACYLVLMRHRTVLLSQVTQYLKHKFQIN